MVPQKMIIKRNEAAFLLGCSTRTLDRMIGDGRIPKPITFSKKNSGWTREVFDAWLEQKRTEAVDEVPNE